VDKIDIIVTQIDHDDWLGYYIGENLYSYGEYSSFSEEEIVKEVILQAIDNGLIKNRKEADRLKIIWKSHLNWDCMSDDLYDAGIEHFSNELPKTLTEMKNWYIKESKKSKRKKK
jgi:hypothetical protein